MAYAANHSGMVVVAHAYRARAAPAFYVWHFPVAATLLTALPDRQRYQRLIGADNDSHHLYLGVALMNVLGLVVLLADGEELRRGILKVFAAFAQAVQPAWWSARPYFSCPALTPGCWSTSYRSTSVTAVLSRWWQPVWAAASRQGRAKASWHRLAGRISIWHRLAAVLIWRSDANTSEKALP